MLKLSLMMACGFVAILTVLVGLKVLPVAVLGWYVAISLATFLLYRYDKQAAKQGNWRVQEATLHKLALAGGWVGAALAQSVLRHKSQKPEFRKHFYLTVIGNIVGLGVIWFIKFRT